LQYTETHEWLPATISTFGFGYGLDSDLLVKLATFGSSSYSFIPDPGFVGTIFVNTLSNLLVTMAREVYLDLEPNSGSEIVVVDDCIMAGYPVTSSGGSFVRVSLGTLQYGQSKDIILPMKICTTSGPFLVITAQYEPAGADLIAPVQLTPLKAMLVDTAIDTERVERHWCRSIFADAIAHAIKEGIDNRLDGARDVLRRVTERVVATSVSEVDCVRALLDDIYGQCTEALSKEEYFTKWGLHYLPSIMFAHRLQQCNNFKDPGVQCYGGNLFNEIRDAADDIFNDLPAPKPSKVVRQADAAMIHAPVSMAAYNNCYGG